MAEKIIVGYSTSNPLAVFENPTIKSCDCILSSSMSGDQLAYDEFRPVVYSAVYITGYFVPKGSAGLLTADGKRLITQRGGFYPDKIPYGTPIWYYSNNKLVGKFYAQQSTRSAKYLFNILAVSAAGILDGQQHLGGLYNGQSFKDVATEIIGGEFSFTCADEVARIPVYGWLPIATKRENLHQLLFAYGVKLDKTATGDVHFAFPNILMEKNIPDGRIFLGGQINYTAPATKAEVTEHSYSALPTDKEVTLFDNTADEAASNTFVSFQEAPVYDLAVSGTLEIISSGVNWAIVSGVGTLSGKVYTHTTRVSTKTADKKSAEKVVSVTDATLVSVLNSRNVSNRVLSYYNSAKTITADIVVDGELPGDRVKFNDPYNEPTTAFVQSMDISATSFLRASCELVANYTPEGQGNNYSSAVLLTGSGKYTFPAGTESAVVVLISEGSGGSAGGRGYNATNQIYFGGGEAGQGGTKGTGGEGGRILVVTLDNPVGSFNYSCGTGSGLGGPPTEEHYAIPGAVGADTTFGSYTTESGISSRNGYTNLFTGEVYATPGVDGVDGGAGADHSSSGTNVFFNGKTYTPGKKGKTVTAQNSWQEAYGEGGYGGGPAAGSNGGNGGDGSARVSGEDDYNGRGGSGGNGAVPVDGTNATKYGCGGNGGHGGGGGGNGGGGSGTDTGGRKYGSPGDGGLGSKGGDAAPGCILIYL